MTELYRESWKELSYEDRKRQIKIRELNDRLRKMLPRTQDMILIVGALKNESAALQTLVYSAARTFDAFTEDNDPYGEHDCATFKIEGHEGTFMFQISYYDLELKYHSVDAADPSVTRRVMTLMYAYDR